MPWGMDRDSLPSVNFTAAEIAQWQQESAAIDAEIERLRKGKAGIEDKLRAAQLLFPSLFLIAQPEKGKGRGQAIFRKGLLTWPHIIEDAVRGSVTGIRQKELLDDIRDGKHGKPLTSESAFYNAIQKVLKHRKTVIKHGEWLFTPAQFQDYMRKVEAGEIRDCAQNVEFGSPSGAEIVRFVTKHPHSKSPDIIAHVWAVQEANGEARQSRTSLYNVIRRLTDQRKLSKDSKGGYVPYEENEPPAENPPSGSDTGEVAASLFENVVGFPRSR